jgi:hypothetical protein
MDGLFQKALASSLVGIGMGLALRVCLHKPGRDHLGSFSAKYLLQRRMKRKIAAIPISAEPM